MNIREEIIEKIKEAIKSLGVDEDLHIQLSIPQDMTHGDYSTNIAFVLSKMLKKNPKELAEELANKIVDNRLTVKAQGGFINFWLSSTYLIAHLDNLTNSGKKNIPMAKTHSAISVQVKNTKIMVEFAHPNTHKEMHIGHMRTLITGESLSRIFESQGREVFRANYQGDIGPHVAKALYGIEVLMKEKSLLLEEIQKWNNKDKAHFLGEGYARGNQDYEKEKEKIDQINNQLYQKIHGHYWDLYQKTRKWSLDYYEEFYTRFYTKFDRLFFESEMVDKGKEIVKKHIGEVFVQDKDGSIIFPGEKYGLHTRVFITQAGNPTYEGKEMGNAYAEWEAFHFDKKVHVVANEQAGYFQVVFKALELLDEEKFKDKQYHLSMGMVQLTDRKMSSRTGDVLTVDWLIDQVKKAAADLFKEGKLSASEKEEVLEQICIGAVKYSVLKGGTAQNVSFDIEKSVTLDGNSGPYIQYAYTRTQSILEKRKASRVKGKEESSFPLNASRLTLAPEEQILLRKLYQFSEIVEQAAEKYAPNMLCEYLFELAQTFNLFYQKHRIIDVSTSDVEPQNTSEVSRFRLALTQAVGIVLKQGLYLLGIAAPTRM